MTKTLAFDLFLSTESPGPHFLDDMGDHDQILQYRTLFVFLVLFCWVFFQYMLSKYDFDTILS